MPRRALTPAGKKRMQAARAQAQTDKKTALAAAWEKRSLQTPGVCSTRWSLKLADVPCKYLRGPVIVP